MKTGSPKIVCNSNVLNGGPGSGPQAGGGGASTPYDDHFEHGEKGKGVAKAYAKEVAGKLQSKGLHEKFKAATPEQRAGVMKSSGAYEKAPASVAEHFESQDKFHSFMASAVHHELTH